VCAKILAPLAILSILFASPSICRASPVTSEKEEFLELQQQVRELVQQLSEMRREHAAEIEALNQNVAELRRATASGARPEQGAVEVDDLEALRRAAATEASKEAKAEELPEEKVFSFGSLGLQALNPEISLTGDMLGSYLSGDDVTNQWDWDFRALGIHFETYLDPYSRFKASVPVNEDGAELEEAYLTRYGVIGNLNVTLGKFRQQFGVVNRWHKHALDWFDFPRALRYVFGNEGLNQTGTSLDWNGSIGPLAQEVILQVTDGDNGRMFGENSKNRPSVLAHYKLYRDLSPSTYVELGATGLVGWNNRWLMSDGSIDKDALVAQVYGVDFTLAWEPTDRMRYRNLEWRNEFYIVDKKIQAPDGSGSDALHPWGAYSSLQVKVSRTIDLGARFDYYRPEAKSYAALGGGLSLFPLAVTDSGSERYAVGVFATWWQSPFVRFRVGYSHERGSGMGADEHIATFQTVFAAGPHKHERY
jgi:hypothetical protein